MKSLIALIRREYYEHRGAFLFAPTVILAIVACIVLSAATLGRFDTLQKVGSITGSKGFEFGFLIVGAMWMVYLLAALFFYFADAFSADSRNNSMLFWKSMPQSDFKMLASKMAAGLTIFPALIFGAVLLSGVVVAIGVLIMQITHPGTLGMQPMGFVTSALNIAAFDIVYIVLAMLWYAPFFAWVGLLSTLFRRWSIPLAFLIPGLVGLAENLLFRAFDSGPPAGYVIGYLRHRLDFSIDREAMGTALFKPTPFDAIGFLGQFLSEIDWLQLGGGLVVAVALVYLASEYRRRVLAS